MKKIILSLAAALSMTFAHAYDYAYLVLQKTDGSTVKVSTAGLSLSYDAAAAQLTVGNTAYTVADLRCMYFTNSDADATAIDQINTASPDTPSIDEADAIYDLRGHEVSRSANGTLPKGIYIIKKRNKSTKVIVK